MEIVISNLNKYIGKIELDRLFSRYGFVLAVRVEYRYSRSADDVVSQGVGYVWMPTEREARRALAKLNGRMWRGKKIRVEDGGRGSYWED